MGYDERRENNPDNNRENTLLDAGLRGLARGIEGLRGLVSQIADPDAPPRPQPLGGPGRRPPRPAPAVPHNSAGAREPIVDIFDEGEVIRIVADMPGADPATLRLRNAGNRLAITATGPARRYERIVTLPAPVHCDDSAGVPTFNNGIMEALLPVERPAPAPPVALVEPAQPEETTDERSEPDGGTDGDAHE